MSVIPGLTVFTVMPLAATVGATDAHEADDRVLGGVVHRIGRERDEAGERSGGDDRAAAPVHRADRGAQAEDDAVDVDAHDAVVVGVAERR